MKQMKCLDCAEKFEAETPDEMMQAMMPHYMEDHKAMMDGQNEETKQEWMKRFGEAFERAEEV